MRAKCRTSAFNDGNGEAALRLGETYDANFLQWAKLAVQGDPAAAVFWYHRARARRRRGGNLFLGSGTTVIAAERTGRPATAPAGIPRTLTPSSRDPAGNASLSG
jgi:hypothetical protein